MTPTSSPRPTRVTPFQTNFTLGISSQLLYVDSLFGSPKILVFNPMLRQGGPQTMLQVLLYDPNTGAFESCLKTNCHTTEHELSDSHWDKMQQFEFRCMWRQSCADAILLFQDDENTLLSLKPLDEYSYSVETLQTLSASKQYAWSHAFMDPASHQILLLGSIERKNKNYYSIWDLPADKTSTPSLPVLTSTSRHRWKGPSVCVNYDSSSRQFFFFGGIDFQSLPLHPSGEFFCFSLDSKKFTSIIPDTKNLPNLPSPRNEVPCCVFNQSWWIGGQDLWEYRIQEKRWIAHGRPPGWKSSFSRMQMFHDSNKSLKALLVDIRDHSSCCYIMEFK